MTTEQALRKAIEAAAHGELCAVLGGYDDTPCNCWKAAALALPETAGRVEEDAWLIYFADTEVGPEIFTGEGAEDCAKERFNQLCQSWTCWLFQCVESSKRMVNLPVNPPVIPYSIIIPFPNAASEAINSEDLACMNDANDRARATQSVPVIPDTDLQK